MIAMLCPKCKATIKKVCNYCKDKTDDMCRFQTCRMKKVEGSSLCEHHNRVIDDLLTLPEVK